MASCRTSPFGLYRQLRWLWGQRPRKISYVPSITFLTFRFPYAGGFFETVFPDSWSRPWPSPSYERLGFLFSGKPVNLTTLQNSLYVTDCYFASPSQRDISLRHVESPPAPETCYLALWRLPGLDFHQQAIDSFA